MQYLGVSSVHQLVVVGCLCISESVHTISMIPGKNQVLHTDASINHQVRGTRT
jgi:hypothetical protein